MKSELLKVSMIETSIENRKYAELGFQNNKHCFQKNIGGPYGLLTESYKQ